MSNDKAVVRQDVERIPEVSRTWIEWGEQGVKTLVVEVTFDTEGSPAGFGAGNGVTAGLSADARSSFRQHALKPLHSG